MDKKETESSGQNHPASIIPPPQALAPGMAPRVDSISMYTNFNAPRLSTDASINSFLNISETQGQSLGGVQNLQQSGQQSQPQQGQLRQDPGPYSRGYSIINGFWPGSSAGQSQMPTQQDAGNQFTAVRRQSEQLEPFFPRFKTPSFSSGRSGSIQYQQQYVPPPSGGGHRGSDILIPGSKRNSFFFSGAEPPDLDFFTSGKRDSQPIMKPPHILPHRNSSSAGLPFLRRPSLSNPLSHLNNPPAGIANDSPSTSLENNHHSSVPTIASTDSAGNAPLNANVSTDSRAAPPPTQDSDLEAIFNQSLSSRKNSLRFSTDDFDFDFRRRESSIRGLLDNQGFIPMLSSGTNKIGLKDLPPRAKSLSGSPLPRSPADDDFGAHFRTQAPPMPQRNELATQDKDDSEPPERKIRRMGQDESPKVKAEPLENTVNYLEPKELLLASDDGRPLLGATKVDQLMLMIQARKKGVTDRVPRNADGSLLLEDAPSIIPPMSELVGGVEKPKSRCTKQHECPYCHKCFTQATHLEVHVRSHIGYKPFQCEHCGKRFTQGGNLRTHIRLHTGEKPYECEKCGRKFSRKGNLAAHRLTHENLRPFSCKLDGCNKSFTQLGNMKAHQNRFHLHTLNALTQRLAEMDPNEDIASEERELLEYIGDLYKNSNRGIKGRGKGNTRIAKSDFSPQFTATQPQSSNSAKLLATGNPSQVIPKTMALPQPMDPTDRPDIPYKPDLVTDDPSNQLTGHSSQGALGAVGDQPSTSDPRDHGYQYNVGSQVKLEPRDQFRSHINGGTGMRFKNVTY
ncbi:LADA_0D07338g1_1 [Lachancea dasiensis]|uniref:LADA_0D07338g1_1 n=1 Tax=Lachancea dasiensis TaxID=1072105 RepID=A0A1G4J6C2_9SACH|nr:LADA_0D07338g1_1 [Lachancea dasiensis]